MATENTSSLDIPIIVQEALTQDSEYYIEYEVRQDMPGMDRINEPLTVGVPLAEDSGIMNITQLGLSGVDLQQFRSLAYWPNGNIKWVLVDTQASILANEQISISLIDGAGNTEGTMAFDYVDHIEIDTGVAQFKIKKSNFNFIDEAIVDGTELVSSSNSGGISMKGHDDATYLLDSISHTLTIDAIYDSKNDDNSTAIIEENGPVRTVVKATGSFKDASGNRFLDYTVRFHFYKDKSFVKPIIIIRHGQEEKHENESGGYNQVNRIFSSMQATIPMNLGVTKTFTFAGRTSDIQGTIDESAYMFQAYSEAHKSSIIEDDVKDGNWDWLFPPMEKTTEYVQKGFQVQNGTITLNPLSDENDWTIGYAEIKDQDDSGLTLAMKYMSAYWPASFEFGADGVVEIGIYSKRNSKDDIAMGWGTHESRELMLDFHVAPVNNLESVYRLEQPIVGRNTIFHYGNTKAFFESEGIVSEDQFNQFFIDNYGEVDYFHPKSPWHQTNTGVVVWRTFWYSGVAGTDLPMSSLYTFLKTGLGGRYMSSLQKTIYNTDSAVIRSDDFDYSESIIKTSYKYPIITTGSYNSGGGQNHFDYYGHNHWRAMPFFYYLTGNEEIKDTINDYLEEFVKKGSLTGLDSMRSHARFCSTLALGYEFNLDERLMTILEEMIGVLLSSRDNPPNMEPAGRNMERGYLSMDAEYWGEPTIHSFFLNSIHSQDIWQVLRVIKKLNPTYNRTIEIDDYLLGVSQFMYHELHFDEPAGDDFGFIYNYRLNNVNEWIDEVVDGNYMRKDDCSRAMLHAYINSGNEMYLMMGIKYLAYGGGVGSSTPFPANDLIYADLYGINDYWNYLNNVNVVDNGTNNYTLTWIVPEGATVYKIKYSDKPIVDWLGFDQATRTYQYSPESYVAFFAAINIDNNPIPLTEGTEQSIVIDVEQAIASHNTIRGLTPDNPSYIVYDSEKSYYFDIKYNSYINIYDPCEGVVCDDICIDNDLWSQKCVEGECIPNQLIETNSVSCEIPTIDILLVGSGFTFDEMDEFILKVDQNIEKTLSVNWFNDNSSLFNFLRVDIVSPESGVDIDDATIYSAASSVPHDILVVIHNYEGQESVINPYVDLYTSSHNYVVLAHELGHTIGKLDDEYYTPAMAYKCDGLSKRTLNIHDRPNNEKWSDLISTPPFEGARYCEFGLWRPSENSIMKDSANTPYFDAVGYKAMDLGAGKIIGTISSTQPGLEISGVQNDDTKSGILDVEAITSSLVGIERVEFYWAKAGDTSKSIKIDRTYPYEISIDTTQYENGQYYLDTIAYDINWNYIRVTILFNVYNENNLCEGVVCPNVCIGTDLYSQKCDSATGNCINDQLIENNSVSCEIPTDEDTITKYLMLGGLGLIGYMMLMKDKK